MINTTVDIEKGAVIFKLKNNVGMIVYLAEYLQNDTQIIVKIRKIARNSVPYDVIRNEYTWKDEDEKKIKETTAKTRFQELIEEYKTLIESEDHQEVTPEKVFKSAVNYHVVDPSRCLNCEYSCFRPENTKISSWRDNFELICNNTANIRYYRNIEQEFKEGGSYAKINFVTVDINGICNNYKLQNQSKTHEFDKYLLKDYLMKDHDLIDLIKTMQENRLVEFEDEIYIKNGDFNPKFKANVLSVVASNVSTSPELCAAINTRVETVMDNTVIGEIRGGSDKKDDNGDGKADEENNSESITKSFYSTLIYGNLGA